MTTAAFEAPAVVSVEALLATPDAFRQWLNGKDHGAIVGAAAQMFECPIRNFLAEQGVDEPAVGAGEVRWAYAYTMSQEQAQRCPGYRLPAWAKRFIGLVDKRSMDTPIRASLAAALLWQAVNEAPA